MSSSSLSTSVVPLTAAWDTQVTIKEPAKGDTLGYIDPVRRGMTFCALTAADAPLIIKAVRTPYECFTVEECLGKGRGKLTLRLQLNRTIWTSLRNLDELFKAFLIKHRHKLFTSGDADYIGRDPNAIGLKYKGLAPFTGEHEPAYDDFITVRINGRAGEIEGIVCKEGSTGKYVSGVQWAGRTAPLTAAATRFSMVTGFTDAGKPILRETLPINGVVPVGGQRVRYVGPGDISAEGCVARYMTLRPAYWALAPGGSATITLVIDHIVIQNMTEEGESALPAAPLQVPEGFTLYNDETGEAQPASNAMAQSAGVPMPKHESKKRKVVVLAPLVVAPARIMTRQASIMAAAGAGDEDEDDEEGDAEGSATHRAERFEESQRMADPESRHLVDGVDY